MFLYLRTRSSTHNAQRTIRMDLSLSTTMIATNSKIIEWEGLVLFLQSKTAALLAASLGVTAHDISLRWCRLSVERC